jgi:hypothetical protein
MAEATPYEEQRRRQVEANKRKLEELQLHHLSAAIREAAAAAKPSLVCPGSWPMAIIDVLDVFLLVALLYPVGFYAGQEAEGAGASRRRRRRDGASTAVRPARQPPG